MQRRSFFRSVGLGAATLALPGALRTTRAAGVATPAESWPPQIAADSPRPNFLWISIEDTSPTLGCYGDAYATTPNLDRLASQGVRYERAFTHAPVCAPSRSGLITGMYPTSIGTTWMRCKGVPPVESRCFPEYLRAAGYYCTNNSKTDYQFGAPASAWDESSKNGHWRSRPDKSQPFFAIINLGTTHESSTRRFTPGQEFNHDPAKAPLPPYYPDTPLVRENVACLYDRVTECDAAIQKILDQLEADGLADNTIVWFWGDHGWGLTRGKRWIYDSGLRVPLLIRVPEKLRAWAGAGDASAVAPGRVEGELVSFMDFAPTMLSLVGVAVPPHMQGQAFLGPQKARQPREYVFGARDRMDETYDFIRCCRDKQFKLIRNYMPYLTRAQNIDYMDRTPILMEMRRLHAEGKLAGAAQLQFFEPTKPVYELYDIVADPHEVNNLAGDPKYAPVVARMQQAIDDWMRRIGDIGFIPECDFDELKGGGVAASPAIMPVVGSGGADGKPVRVALSCPTKGASLVYRLAADGESEKGEKSAKSEKGIARLASPAAAQAPGAPETGGVIVLPARRATIHGGGAKLAGEVILSYRGADTYLTWDLDVPAAGKYPVYVSQANSGKGGSQFELTIGDAAKLTGTIQHTASWDDYVVIPIGEVEFAKPGKYPVTLRPIKQVDGRLGNVHAVVVGGPADAAAVQAQLALPAAPASRTDRKAAKASDKAPDKGAVAGAGAQRRWLLYCEPVELKPGQTLEAQAWRLGYSPSPVAHYAYGQPAIPAGSPTDPPISWRERVNASGMLERCRALKEYDGRWREGVDAFLNALADEAAPVRYWAIVGLHQASKQDGAPPVGADPAIVARALPAVEPLLKDPSASVRSAAGEALCDWGQCDRGLAALLEVVTGKTGMGADYAAWALWRLGEKARPILPQLQQAKPAAGRYPAAALKRVVDRLKQG